MNHHIISTLLKNKPDIIIPHSVINHVLNRFEQGQIIKNVTNDTFKNFNVSQVIILRIVSCKRADNSVLNYINENLKIESMSK